MNREKQIEEITAIIDSVLGSSPTLVLQSRVNGGKYKSIKNSEIAEDLYNAGYRKMDGITLKLDLGDRLAEEIQQIAEAFNKAMANEQPLITVPSNEEEITKRVAKEILQSLKTVFNLRAKEYTNWDTNKVMAVTIDWINADLAETAKEYGVEIDK